MKKLTIILEEDDSKLTLEYDPDGWSGSNDYNRYLQVMINALRGVGKFIPEEEDRV